MWHEVLEVGSVVKPVASACRTCRSLKPSFLRTRLMLSFAFFPEPFGHFAAWPKRGKPGTQQVSLLNPQVPGQIPVVAFLGEENQSR